MKHYVIATQREWGVKVFKRLRIPSTSFVLYDDTAHTWTEQLLAAMLAMDVPRYVFFLNWSSRVPLEVLEMSPIVEAVNFHCTSLPYGRGGGPIENLILRGHTETVITAHRMTDVIDGGPIYGTRGPVSLAGTKEQILERFIEPCVALIRWIIETEPESYPQVGPVVAFKRLPRAEFENFWKERV